MAGALSAASCGGSSPAPEREATYFPPAGGPWATVDLTEAGWDPVGVEAALSYAASQHSSAVLMVVHGRIAAEQYWALEPSQPVGPTTTYGVTGIFELDSLGRPIEDVMSVQKSAISVLLAMARDKGLLNLDDPVSEHLGAGWSNAPADAESAILVRHLASMSSGLARDLSFEAEAGSRWRYNTLAYSRLLQVLEQSAVMTAEQLTREWLTAPLGMQQSGWRERAWWTPASSANTVGFATSARDLARLGILVQTGGVWEGETLVQNRGLLEESFRSSQDMNPSYGLLWWVNGQDSWEDYDHRGSVPGSFIPTAPADLVAARGNGDRRLYVVPSLDLVVVRLGAPTLDAEGVQDLNVFDREFWRLLSVAAPTGHDQAAGD